MARKRRRVEASEIKNTGLEPAWPSCPHRNPRFALSCTNIETNRLYVVNSYSCYAIKKILDRLLGDREWEQKSPLIIQMGDIDIKSDELEDIMEHEYTDEEEGYILPPPYPNEIDRFLFGQRLSNNIIETKRNERGELPHVAAKVRVDKTGMITIQTLCDELKILPRDARAKLRKAKIEKPTGGWLWAADKVDDIKKVISK